MAPTIWSDKKLHHSRSGVKGVGVGFGSNLMNLRRPSRILRRNQAPPVSSMFNCVSKGTHIDTTVQLLLRRTNSKRISSNGTNASTIGDELHQEENKKQQQLEEDEQRAELNDQKMMASSSRPSSSLSTSGPPVSKSISKTVSSEERVAFHDRNHRNRYDSNQNHSFSRSRSCSRSRSHRRSRSRSRSSGYNYNHSPHRGIYADRARSRSCNSRSSNSSLPCSENSFDSMYSSDIEYDDVVDEDNGSDTIHSDDDDILLDTSSINESLNDSNDIYEQAICGLPNPIYVNDENRDKEHQRHTSVICRVTNRNTNIASNNVNCIDINKISNTENNNNISNNNTNNISNEIHNRNIYSNLCDIKNSEGLLSIAIKTIRLVKRNQLLQRRLVQLQLETSEFIQSVMANPENRHLREKILKRGELEQEQQKEEHRENQQQKQQQHHGKILIKEEKNLAINEK